MIDLERTIADYATFLDEQSLARSSDHIIQSEPDGGEVIMVDIQIRETGTDDTANEASKRRWLPYTILAAAAAILVLVALTLFDGTEQSTPVDVVDTPVDVDVPAPTEEVEPPATSASTDAADAVENLAIATRFIEARDAYDSETVSSLVAADASIVDLFYARPDLPDTISADDFLTIADFERATGARFLEPVCTAGSPGRVSCAYNWENDWTRALGDDRYTGNGFLFEITDGQIQQLNHNFAQRSADSIDAHVLMVVATWVLENHPQDRAALFNDSLFPLATPETVDFWEMYNDDFIASVTDSETP